LRVAHRDELTAAIETAFSAEPADEWLRSLAEAGIPAGKVRDFQQVYEWDQTISQGLLIDVDHPTLGPIQLPGPPLRFDDNPYAGARETNLPPPRLGEHDDSVRAWLEE
jgi:crotonobetainyl-CoA:carnitine CoA-transferase CaiB-like acyl-CoA transferase